MRKSAATLVVLCLIALGLAVPTVAGAAGSRELYPTDATCAAGGSCRANIEFRTGQYGGSIYRRTIFSVYATAGQYLEMGSSAVGVAGAGGATGDAVAWNPGVVTNDQAATLPATSYSCNAQAGRPGTTSNLGQITSRAQELAGPQAITGGGNSTGYVPCYYKAPTTGIYKVAFYGPDGPSSNNNGTPTGDITMSAAANFSSAQGSNVSAFDITVRASTTSSTDIKGRVFTYALASFTGNNDRPINESIYVTTLDGYKYQANTNGLDPNGFLFYGNERGFVTSDGQTPLNHDVLGSDGSLSTIQGGAALFAPEYPLSFYPLAAETLAALQIPSTPTLPGVNNLTYSGSIASNNSTVGAGGTFTFDQSAHGTYEIVISGGNGNFDPGVSTNRVLLGVRDAGSQTVTWDGNDNAGNPFPVGSAYAVHARVESGVYHFPLIDAENSVNGGPSFLLTNEPAQTCPFVDTAGNPLSAAACATRAFYDDRGYHTSGADVGTPGSTLCGLNPPSINHSDPVNGYDSSTNQRAYGASPGSNTNNSCTGSFGDAKGLDTWAFYPSRTLTTSLNVVSNPPAAPQANADTAKAGQGTILTVPAASGVLANDTGTGITVTGHTDPAHGTLTIGTDGSYSYTPTAGYSGTDSFSYTITDNLGRTSTATDSITVLPTPKANDDSAATGLNTTLTVTAAGGVLANDTGTGISVTGHTNPAHGTLTINADGSYSYTPAAGYTGTDSFTYTITDGAGQTATATDSISVLAKPVAVNDSATTGINQTFSRTTGTGLLANDSGTRLTVTGHSTPTHGTLTINTDGSYSYTPTTGYTGTDSFTYTVTDAAGQTATATDTITILAKPTTQPDSATTAINTTLSGASVLTNDSGTGLMVTGHSTPAHGTLTTNADGTYSYTPTSGYTGTDSFTYTVTDAAGQTATGTVSLQIDAKPVATDDSASTGVGVGVTRTAVNGLLANDTGTAISITAHTDPTHGTLTISADGSYTYTPTAGYVGTDSFTYTITDSAGQTATATDRITVLAKPVANADMATTGAGTILTVPASSGVLTNDTGTSISVTAHTDPAHGTLTIAADGGYTYTPTTGYSGSDGFTYTITDAAGQTATGTVSLSVLPAPKAKDDSATVSINSTLTQDAAHGVLTNDTGTNISVTQHTGPAHGTLTINADGSYSYTPITGYTGADSFTYTITDGAGQTSTATVALSVIAAPVANNDSGSVGINGTRTVTAADGVLANDTGTDISVTGHTNPAHGTVTIGTDGGYTYQPATGYTGTDSFSYTITDSAGKNSTATVALTVLAEPVAVNDSATTGIDQTVSRTTGTGLLANDSGTNISVTTNTDPTHGTVTVNADGSYTYTPTAGYVGTDSFTYTITDAAGQTATATDTITILAKPVATDDSAATGVGVTVTRAPAAGLLANDSGTNISVTTNTDPTHGTVTVKADGSYTYTPTAGYVGTDSFTYTITDSVGQTATATDTITILAKPVAKPDSGITGINTPLSGTSVLTNDSGTDLTVTGDSTPAHGNVTVNPDGSYVYTPLNGYSGADSFTYTVTDPAGQSATGTVSIQVDATPVAIDDSAATGVGVTVTRTPAAGLLANDSGTAITVTSNGTPAHGTVTVNTDGSYSYVPLAGYVGSDSFTYVITDSAGQTATATDRITILAKPVATDDRATTSSGVAVSRTADTGLLGNDTGAGITVTAVSQPGHGTVAVQPDGSYTYTPTAGYVGTDSFTYTITDAAGQTATATDTITLISGPVADDDSAVTSVNTDVGRTTANGLLVNDSGTGLYVTAVTQPKHGTLSVSSAGAYTYQPDPGFTGTDSVDYTVTDAAGATATATLTITVLARPVARDDSATTGQDTVLSVPVGSGVLHNDAGSGIAVTGNTDPQHGTITLRADGSYDYTPTSGFTGTDSVDYTITDAAGATATATLTITVLARPVAVDDKETTSIDSPRTVSAAAGLLSNDTGTGIAVAQHSDPQHGTVTVQADGSYTYTPATGYTGIDSFTYTIVDDAGQTATATDTITIIDGPVAHADHGYTPVSTPLTVDATQGVLDNDSGSQITVTQNTDPQHGTIALDADGSYVYTPTTGFTGTDSVDYTITDAAGKTATATLTIDVLAVPRASDDRGGTTAGTPLSVPAGEGVLDNDTGTSLHVSRHTDPVHGTITLLADGSYTYVPADGFSGTDSVSYTVTDPAGQTATAVLRLTVTPVAVADHATTTVDTGLSGDSVLSNDLGSGLHVTGHTAPAHGTVVVDADGSYVYTPAAGYTGSDAFTYTATDSAGQPTSTTVTITVTPLARDDAGRTTVGSKLTVDAAAGLLANDAGRGLHVTGNTAPAHGHVTVAADGSYVYTPVAGFSGADTFSYSVTDAAGSIASATVTIVVTPRAVPDSASTPLNTPVTLHPAANDLGTGLRVTAVTQPPASEGSVRIVDGAVVFTPATGFTGSAQYSYTVTDAAGQTATSVDTVTVRGAVIAATPDTGSTVAQRPVTVRPLANDRHTSALLAATVRLVDPKTGALVTRLTVAGEGTYVVDTATGTVTFTAVEGFTGTATPVAYRVIDAAGAVHGSTITITVRRAATSAPATTVGGVRLPQTGFPLLMESVGGLALLLGGAALVAAGRRRPQGRHAR